MMPSDAGTLHASEVLHGVRWTGALTGVRIFGNN